jgi:hypothetical protein
MLLDELDFSLIQHDAVKANAILFKAPLAYKQASHSVQGLGK